MICSRIWVVPLEIAHDRRWISRFSGQQRVLAVHKDDLAGDQVAVQGSPGLATRSPRGKRVSSGSNGRDPFQHTSRYYLQVERPYPLEVR